MKGVVTSVQDPNKIRFEIVKEIKKKKKLNQWRKPFKAESWWKCFYIILSLHNTIFMGWLVKQLYEAMDKYCLRNLPWYFLYYKKDSISRLRSSIPMQDTCMNFQIDTILREEVSFLRLREFGDQYSSSLLIYSIHCNKCGTHDC